MVNAIEGDNSVAARQEPKELMPLTFAEDLAPNVWAGFNSRCDYIHKSHVS
jgi:hypothetical protein